MGKWLSCWQPLPHDHERPLAPRAALSCVAVVLARATNETGAPQGIGHRTIPTVTRAGVARGTTTPTSAPARTRLTTLPRRVTTVPLRHTTTQRRHTTASLRLATASRRLAPGSL
jgi:hypothetical protein